MCSPQVTSQLSSLLPAQSKPKVIFSLVQRVFIVEQYFAYRSYVGCQNAFRQAFPESPVPNKSTICRTIERFCKTGTVKDKSRSGRPSVLSDETLKTVHQCLLRAPTQSLRQLSQDSGISYGSVQKATKILDLRTYDVLVTPELRETDKEKRIRYCQWFRNFIRSDVAVLDKVFFTDEAWFYLNGYVHNQNNRMWNSETLFDQPLLATKVGVWCAISRRRVVGPFFLDDSLSAEEYQDLIAQFVSMLEVDEQECWFQQNGTPEQVAETTINMLAEFFGGRIISESLWPPLSPDLSPLQFFLWEFLKQHVYLNNPRTVQDLQRNIEICIANLTASTLCLVSSNMVNRIEVCYSEGGARFQHLL